MQDQKVEINLEAATRAVCKISRLQKKGFLKKAPVLESLFNKFAGLQAQTIKNIYSEEHLRKAAPFKSQLIGITKIFSILKKIIENCH